MRIINLSIVCLMILLGTSFCFAGNFIFNTEFQETIKTSDYFKLEPDWSASVYLKSPILNLTLGKDRFVWGVGQTGTLALSPTSPSISFFQYQITLPMIQYKYFISPLERETNRWLFGHRLDGKLSSIQVGIWEMMLSSGEVFPAYYVPIPLFPLYAKQHISYKFFNRNYDRNSNAMLGIDFKYNIREIGELYGELLVDDFPGSIDSITPKKIAGLIGVCWDNFWNQCDLWVEYIRINNFVYTHENPSSRYVSKGQPFGHWLGMDGDLWAIGVNQTYTEETELRWQLHYIRRGEGNYTDNWQHEFLDEYSFLTGVVETSCEIQIDVKHQFTEQLQGELSSVIGFAKNASHVENAYGSYWKSRFTIIFDLF